MSGYAARPIADRFWEKVDKSGGPMACWEWRASLDHKGYGQFMIKSKPTVGVRAHRMAWSLTHGGMPPRASFVCHRCDNPKCCNPAHMFLGNNAANMADCRAKDRHNRGERVPQSKLTEHTVREIVARAGAGEKTSVLAQEYGVIGRTINRIKRGEAWAYLGLCTGHAKAALAVAVVAADRMAQEVQP